MALIAPEIRSFTTDETRNISIDCSEVLDDGELLTGSPTIQCNAEITVTNEQVNAGAVVINGDSVAAGSAIQFTATCSTPGTYYIEAKCNTDAGQLIEGRIKVVVERSLF